MNSFERDDVLWIEERLLEKRMVDLKFFSVQYFNKIDELNMLVY